MNWQPSQFAQHLLSWFATHGRHTLPWQSSPSSYRVWVSEVMLQQTQVSTVMPFYERFMARFPDVRSLAAGSLDEVLHLWTGLGYYARARNLHACARIVVANYDGNFPEQIEAMIELPGIGRSTAGAILALAYGQRHPILDGNVKRVMARVFGISGNPGSSAVNAALWAKSDECTPTSEVAAYTQAIMDLGATVCMRTRPRCGSCPMHEGCFAAQECRQAELPGRKQKRIRPSRQATLLIAQSGSNASIAVLVERRPASGLWGGLWSPPQFDCENDALVWCGRELNAVRGSSQKLPSIEHAFTHFDLTLNPVRIHCERGAQVREGQDRLWYPLHMPPLIGLPQPIRRLFEQLRAATAS